MLKSQEWENVLEIRPIHIFNSGLPLRPMALTLYCNYFETKI